MRPGFLRQTMRWEAAHGLQGKCDAVWAQLTQLPTTGLVSVLSLEYGPDNDQAVERVAHYLDSRAAASEYYGNGPGLARSGYDGD